MNDAHKLYRKMDQLMRFSFFVMNRDVTVKIFWRCNMKANIRKLFNRIVALLLAVLISSGVPITAFAESNSLHSEIKANDTFVIILS